MKFVVTWVLRENDLEPKDRIKEQRRIFEAFKRYLPDNAESILQWVTRVDGQGGTAVVDTDDPHGLAQAPSLFGAWYEWDIAPVMDLMDEKTLNLFQAGYDFHS